MPQPSLAIVFLGLSITSSWGNGHATTYRALVRALCNRGHRVLFLERDVPWYADNRDLPRPPYGRTELYRSVGELDERFAGSVADADLVVVGSFVPEGRAVAAWVLDTARRRTAFYDIDTPATLAALMRGDCPYVSAALIPRFDLYLSFTGGPTLRRLEREVGARRARPLYCSFDPEHYFPEPAAPVWDLGYMGTYCADRQPALDRLLVRPARALPESRFVVAGPMYPPDLVWPANVTHRHHVAPGEHRRFYCQQRFTLNLTRADMVAAGYSPSVRLFEAAACGVPILTDSWPGLDEFFTPGQEITVVHDSEDIQRLLGGMDMDPDMNTDAGTWARMASAARQRVLAGHTANHRALALEAYLRELDAPPLGAAAASPAHP